MNLFKYPRTYHLQFSPGLQNDDKMVENPDMFVGKEVVVLEKYDGENSNLYSDYFHARSIDSPHHDSRNWIKGFHGQIRHLIPKDWRICGENLYAKHSIHYKNLESYFMVFSVWFEDNITLSWEATVKFCSNIGLQTVPVLYKGIWNEEVIKNLYTPTKENGDEMEGFVVRNAGAFHYDDFASNVAKYVRKGHVQTDEFWRNQKIVPNELKD
jgi:hypothetical protein